MFIPGLISVVTVIINMGFASLNYYLVSLIGFSNLNTQNEKVMTFTFISSYMNTAIIPLVISSLDYSDFTDNWYVVVGTSI